MHRCLMTAAVVILLAATVDARIWRPSDQAPVSGDFFDLQGTNVRVRTASGIESFAYLDLSTTDRAVVRSELLKAGRQADISRLEELVMGDGTAKTPSDSSPPNNGMRPDGGGDSGVAFPGSNGSGNARGWTDINGNQLAAEFVRVEGSRVILRINGQEQAFPVHGFSAADREWLAEHGGAAGHSSGGESVPPQFGPGIPPAGFGGRPGDGARGRPGFPSRPGFPPGASGPGGSTYGGRPGFPGIPEMPGMAGVFDGTGGRSTGPGGPGSGGMPTMPAQPGMPGSSGGVNGSAGGYGGSASIGGGMAGAPGMASAGRPDRGMANHGLPDRGIPDHGLGASGPGVGGAGFGGGPPSFDPPSFEPPAIAPPPLPDIPIPSWGRMNNGVLECENCGATFNEGSGLQEGDECPECSGGSSYRFRSARGIVKLVIGLFVLAGAGVSAMWKKFSGD